MYPFSFKKGAKINYSNKNFNQKKMNVKRNEPVINGKYNGLFRGICTSIVAGEILYHWNALREGEEYNPPLLAFMNPESQQLLLFPGFQQIESYIRN